MEYKISVVLPVYNAEKFLKNSIEQIINQSIGFENIELILVDDLSNDDSRRIIKEYASKYSNIKPIFLKENSGRPSHPRNVGIDNATAEYMMFLDSDDEIFKDYCETLYNEIKTSNVDIVNCDNASKLNNKVYIKKSIKQINKKTTEISGEDKFFLKHTAWGNIYRSSLIKENNIKFPKTMYEDGVFSIECLLNTNKPVIRLNDYPGYIYLIENDESFTHKISFKTLPSFLEGYELCFKLLDENNLETVKRKLTPSFINMALLILLKLDNIDEGIEKLYEFEKAFKFKIKLNSKFLNMLNTYIIDKKKIKAKLLIKLTQVIYNNAKIRNKIFIKNSNLKPLNNNFFK